MPSTYTSNLGIELPADGELDGVWGDVVNDNMSIIDRATNGSVTLTLSGTSSTLTTSDGTLSDGQYKLLVLGGSPSGTHTITIAPSDAQKIYFVRNTTAQSVVFTQGSGGNVTVATGDSAIIYSDGAGAGAAVVNVSNDFSMSSVKITGGTIDGTTIGGTSPAVGTFTTANATTVDTTNLEVTTLKAKDGTAAGSIADATGVVTLASSVLTTTDINGGTIDGTTIGGSSAAAGTFTTVTASGDLTIADKIVHDGDTNTAIRFPAADTVTVETSGAERLRVDSFGFVGIGASAPLAQLHVATNASGMGLIAGSGVRQLVESSGPAAIQIASGGTTNPAYIFMGLNGDPDATRIASQVGFTQISATGASDYLRFDTGGLNERMRIDSSGNVGIGTTSPRSKADVAGTLTVGDANPPTVNLYRNVALGSSSSAGLLAFGGRYDATNYATGAQISALTPSAWSSTNYGASLLFSTVASGSTTLTERMRIDSSGNVGIGTSSPTASLQVGASPSADRTFQIGSAGATRFVVSTDGTNGLTNIGCTNDSTTGRLAFRTGSALTERMRIDESGNVGIGTSVPSDYNASADNLVVGTTSGNNGITIAAGTASQGSLFFADGTATAAEEAAGYLLYVHSDDSMRVGTANTERMRINSSGNVGIGTTSPATLGTNITTVTVNGTAGGGIQFQRTDATAVTGLVAALSGAFALGSITSTPVTFRTNNTEAMRIDSSGNVGIGTSSPATQLQVESETAVIRVSDPSNVNQRLDIAHNGGSSTLTSGNNTVYGRLALQQWDGTNTRERLVFSATGQIGFLTQAGSEVVHISSTGNVGIGTSSPADKLDIDNGWIRVTSGFGLRFGGTNNSLYASNSTNVMGFNTNGSERMRIDASGNVGIGVTPSPWGNSASVGKALDFSRGGVVSLNGGTVDYVGIFANAYAGTGTDPASATWNYKATGSATLYEGGRAGTHRWYNAPSGTAGNAITFTQAMTLDASGNLGIGTTSPAAKLDVSGGVIADNVSVENASSVSGSGMWGTTTTLAFNTGSTERMRITSTGNVGIGTSSPADLLHVSKNGDSVARVTSADGLGDAAVRFYSGATYKGQVGWDQASDVLAIYAPGNATTPALSVGVNSVIYRNQTAQTSKAAAATLTIAELLTGIIQYTGALATLTLPTGTDIEGGLPATPAVNLSFEFSVINTGSGVVTLGTATGLTLVGGMTVAAAASGLFRVRKTATNTYTIYRIS